MKNLLESLARIFRIQPQQIVRLTVVDDAIDELDVTRFTGQLARMLKTPVNIKWAVFSNGKVTAQVETTDPVQFAEVLRLYLPFATITEMQKVRKRQSAAWLPRQQRRTLDAGDR